MRHITHIIEKNESSTGVAIARRRLCEIDDVLETHRLYSSKQYCLSKSSRWQKFYVNYLQNVFGYLQNVFDGAAKFPERSFGDGGYLNNAPFTPWTRC